MITRVADTMSSDGVIQLEPTLPSSFTKGSEHCLVTSGGDDGFPFFKSHVLKAQGLPDLELLAVNSYRSIQKPAFPICSSKGNVTIHSGDSPGFLH